MSKSETTPERPFWYDGKFLNEVGACENFLQKHPIVRVGGSLFTKDDCTPEESARIYCLPQFLSDAAHYQIFIHYPNFLWQVGRFEESILWSKNL